MIDAYIDFTTPMWLVHYFYSIGAMNLVLNCYTLFLIIFKSDKIDSFKYFMFAFQCSCLLIDFHLTFIMQPQPLYPLPGGFVTGLAANILSAHIMMMPVLTLMSLQFLTLLSCFLKKLIVFRNMKRLTTEPYLYVPFVGTITLAAVVMTILFYNGGLSDAEMVELIKESYPTYEKSFQNLTNYALYRLDFFWIGPLLLILVAIVLCGLFFVYATYYMFTALREFSRTASTNNVKKQKTALISLVVQLITLTTALVPVVLLAFLLLIEYKYSQWCTRIELMLYCFHSTANAMVVVITIPSFRRFTFFWLNRKSSPVVVSVH